MAERRDPPAGRILFTEFDAADKGRPAPMTDAPPDDEVLGFLDAPIPSIDSLASSLGLDFEDDWGEEGAPPPPSPPPPEEEADYIPDVGKPRRPEPEAPPGRSRPTLEEYTRAFPASAPASAAVQAPAPPPSPSPFPDRGEGEDEDIDILSSLAEYAGESDANWRGQRLGVGPAPSRPYAGIKRLDEWYRPPETEAEAEAARPGDPDWYEPPEGASEKAASRPSGDTAVSEMFSNIDLDALWEEKIHHGGPDGEQRSGNTTGVVDMFDDIDLDSLWSERKQLAGGRSGARSPSGKHPARPAPDSPEANASTRILPSGQPGPDTTQIVPQDTRIRSAENASSDPGKARERKRKGKGPRRQGTEAGARGVLDGHDRELAWEEDAPEHREEQPESAPRKKRDSKTELPNSIEELEIGDLIPEAEAEAEAEAKAKTEAGTGTAEPAPSPSAPEPEPEAEAGPERPAASGGDAGAADSYLDNIDFDSLASGVDDSVQAPVFDNSAIAAIGRKKAGSHTDAKRSADDEPEPDDASDADADAPAPAVGGAAVPPPAGHDGEPGEGAPPARAATDARARATVPEGEHEADAAEGENAETPKNAEEEEEAVAVNPMDVFANMDNMDFSDDDGLDDEMKAALLDDGEPVEEEGEGEAAAPPPDVVPTTFRGKLLYRLRKGVDRVVPRDRLEKLQRMIAWRENWWFYCDIAAAIIASASLAVIISYFMWYRT